MGIAFVVVERCRAATALGMAHDHNRFHLKLCDRELDRGANTVEPWGFLEWRRQVGDIADNKKLARVGVEDGGGVHAAVGAGDDERLWGLAALRETAVQRAKFRPAFLAVDAIAFKQVIHGVLQALMAAERKRFREENWLGVGVARGNSLGRGSLMKRWIAILAACVLLASCATAAPDVRRERLSRQIADDAAAFNDAYGQAVSAQILLNILRSRDRLPRYYLAMTGISDSPSWSMTQSGSIGGIPLGESGSPWGFGNVGIERQTQTRPSYAVQPFSAETLTRTAFEPTAPYVFEHYWRSGWPRDLLLMVMVEAIEKTDAEGVRHTFVNEANTIFEDCAPSVDTNGCAFVRELREFMISTSERPAESGIDMERGRPLCGVVDAYGPTTPVKPIAPREGLDCDPVFPIGSTLVRFRLRSLDDMVYYVGELMRAGAMVTDEGAPIEAQVTVRAAGLRGGGQGVPLFRVVPEGAADADIYAASVVYGGHRYYAGPAIGRSCGAASEGGRCQDSAAEGDRSSSVLSLIAEILALNQSPDAIRAPSRLIAE